MATCNSLSAGVGRKYWIRHSLKYSSLQKSFQRNLERHKFLKNFGTDVGNRVNEDVEIPGSDVEFRDLSSPLLWEKTQFC